MIRAKGAANPDADNGDAAADLYITCDEPGCQERSQRKFVYRSTLVWVMRGAGWQIGKQDYCPAHRKKRKF